MTIPTPSVRRLRVFAFDPSLHGRLDSYRINSLTLEVPWETELEAGPVGEYLEVIDVDPASDRFYPPVDLDDPRILAQDGLAPSEANPLFHQQMVYAISMRTVRTFEKALGRVLFWADHRAIENGRYKTQFVRRLRIYPHALREQNAYYSPAKKALLFGYFPSSLNANGAGASSPKINVFTCLSFQIVAHEVTHAILDGMHPRFNEPTNPDVLAFHEAFSDLVALFQGFSHGEILKDQIQKTRGSLEQETLLSQLAQQFGQATGRDGPLRDALGSFSNGEWQIRKPDPTLLERTLSSHARGGVLVSAVFRAFLKVYRARTRDLMRIASGGTGILPEGALHPDLVARLSQEAQNTAARILESSIRALDYLPPVNIEFGDFLRAFVTADFDDDPLDHSGHRPALIESFREWGIYPEGVAAMGETALLWPEGTPLQAKAFRAELKSRLSKLDSQWYLENNRFDIWKKLNSLRFHFWKWLNDPKDRDTKAQLFGLVLDHDEAPPTVYRKKKRTPSVQVHAVRPIQRATADGRLRNEIVVEVTQSRRGYFDPEEQREMDSTNSSFDYEEHGDFKYRAGCSFILDVASQRIKWVVRTPGTIADNDALERVRRHLCGDYVQLDQLDFQAGFPMSLRSLDENRNREQFAVLHGRREGNR